MDIFDIPVEEQETTIVYNRKDKMIEVYSSDRTEITKLLKITNPQNIEVLSKNENGNITSAKFKLDRKQVLLRNIPKKRNIEPGKYNFLQKKKEDANNS